ncbi:hypothetical protein OGAPHI_007238 [Ogataea philodendri]|uniref:Major facilitator superfamily (MFS) profile domain-containing protein n=1 Tax=Ogataea philodendri TaxID=1378263 RepID=A0A9P8SYT9_9ASCO|nr:uncharacterized protein OGAPHI_007238 [Ogataea philodendri]KAH3660033.1 hypothetical protein OGAPHI_007238 [Ogataea philodendri]
MNTKEDDPSLHDDRESAAVEVREKDVNSRPEAFKTTFQEVLCVIVTCLGTATSSIPEGSFQVSLNDLASDFSVDGGQLVWSVSSIALASGSFVLIGGKLADCLGKRHMMVVCFAGFSIASLIAGFMKSYVGLVILRAIEGLFFAPLIPAGASLLGSIYPESRRRNIAFAVYSSGGAIGYIVGLFTGGISVLAFSWKAVQFFTAIFFGVVTIVAFFVIPKDPPLDKVQIRKVLKELDYLGSFLILASFALICFALTQVDATERKWQTPYIYSLLIVGVLLLIVFILVEIYLAKDPIIPMELWKKKDFGLAMLVASLTWVTFIGILGYYPMIYFQYVRRWSAFHTALAALPMGIMGALTNVFVGVTFHLISGKVLLIGGNVCLVGATVVWATLDYHRSYWLGPFWGYILCVIACDITYNVCTMVTVTAVERKNQGAAAGVFNTILQLVAVVGLSLGSVLVSAKDPYYGTPEQNEHPKELFHGLINVFYLGIGFSGLALASSFFVHVGTSGNAEAENTIENLASG